MPQTTLHTPLGELTVFEAEGSIVALDWGRAGHPDPAWEGAADTPLLRRAREQLQDYFDGRRLDFDLPLAPQGTAFRQRVWAALRRIPPGQTRSYAEIGREVGCRAARAIGQANGANPIPIVIPCHRVVGANGALGGYSGGEGPATKRFLLELERRVLARRGEADRAGTTGPARIEGTLL
jgi:methylated-DNA-[protein]-cysteine S-methyltransferase